MFFNGDPSSRKRVDLGGRSSKPRDREKLLEHARLVREERSLFRLQTSAARIIQKCFRGRKVVKAESSKMREQFRLCFGNRCQKVDRGCFLPDSPFLSQLLFFFDARNDGDVSFLVETCRLLHQLIRVSGDVVSVFSSSDYFMRRGVVNSRVKRFTYACVQAVHQNRNRLKDQLLMPCEVLSMPAITLLEAVVILTDPKLPWACKTVTYLSQIHALAQMRDIVVTGLQTVKVQGTSEKVSSLEYLLVHMSCHIGKNLCVCPNADPRWSFYAQILTLPLLWQHFPNLKEVFATKGLTGHYLHQMVLRLRHHTNVLPADPMYGFPAIACLLGNILEIAPADFSRPSCSLDMAIDFAVISAYLLEALPPIKSWRRQNGAVSDEDMAIDEEYTDVITLNRDLEQQISNAIDPRLLQQLITVVYRGTSLLNGSPGVGLQNKEVAAVGAVCTFLLITFNTLPVERIMTGLAYRTDLVPMLWNFMKQCHESQRWPSLSELTANLSADAPGWLLPLAVFCPVYKHMLMIVDNEEFYEKEKPLSLKDIRSLVIILRQALWHILWIIPVKSPNSIKSSSDLSGRKRLSVDFIQYRVSRVTSELLIQLEDWNNRRQFTSPSNFHAQEAFDEAFISQAVTENSRAYDILRQAPFLVPFTSRVKIFTSQLKDARQRHDLHGPMTRFRIRRDRIFEDAFNHLNNLSEETLRGVIRVTTVNEFGVEEAGIDGGGIFKDFMENITRAAFDVQYGLFKETTDHLLYPNPGSGLVHEKHLDYFRFLGIVLGKTMFEGILVDIPFATFFLSKLKQKHNYLNDLPSLDPELYRHLIFLKHYEGDISELELYFVILNNEYGEQTEEELLPGGKDMRVTNENVITFIHLVANHRLNFQIRNQSSYFLSGFELLIEKDWISMFNEHEFQLLISGSLEGLDVDDLRSNTQYNGGYNREHYVIETFWEVLKNFSVENQKKFLKFVTGCSRGPLLGFKYLEPQFCIQRAGGEATEEALDRLPTSATCMNLLKLPPYASKEQLERKLLYAINSDAGFDLS